MLAFTIPGVRIGPVVIGVLLVMLGAALFEMGLILDSEVSWQVAGREGGPPNVSIPANGAFAYWGTGGPGPLSLTQKVIAVWSTAPTGDSMPTLQLEILLLPSGTGVGVLNSTTLNNARIVTISQDSADGTDLPYTVSSPGPSLLAYALANPNPYAVNVTSFGAVVENPYKSNGSSGGYVQLAGLLVVSIAACYMVAAAFSARRRNTSLPLHDSAPV